MPFYGSGLGKWELLGHQNLRCGTPSPFTGREETTAAAAARPGSIDSPLRGNTRNAVSCPLGLKKNEAHVRTHVWCPSSRLSTGCLKCSALFLPTGTV